MMFRKFAGIAMTAGLIFGVPAGVTEADVTAASSGGFQTVSRQLTSASPADACRFLVEDFSSWYDANHSWSGQAENLSLDLQRQCMYEVLPDGGFVRHMEIVFYQPGKTLRLAGGLGPLQGMGVSGALTFQFELKNGQTEITLTYNVSGRSALALDKIAPVVDSVLAAQLERLATYCDEQAD